MRQNFHLSATPLNIQIQQNRCSCFFSLCDIADFIIKDAAAPKDRKCDVRSMSVSGYVNAFKADRFLRTRSLIFRLIRGVFA